MTLLLPALAATFAAFCVWLTVRIVNRRERWAKCALASIVPLGLYVGAYVKMVEPGHFHVSVGPPEGPGEHVLPIYFSLGDRRQTFCETMFAPIHWIDRRVRHEIWTARY